MIELQTLELCYDIQSVSTYDSDSVKEDEEQPKTEKAPPSKLTKAREPSNAAEDVETTLSVVVKSDPGKSEKSGCETEKQTHSGIVLSPLQLGQ